MNAFNNQEIIPPYDEAVQSEMFGNSFQNEHTNTNKNSFALININISSIVFT